MLLNRLELEEREAFMSLAVRAAEANDFVSDEEEAMIREYGRELDIVSFDVKSARSMDEIIACYIGSCEESKRIVVLEIIGLMKADGDFDAKEKEFVFSFAERIGVAKEIVEQLTELVSRYLGLMNEIFCAISTKI